jgi:hypothetical protein
MGHLHSTRTAPPRRWLPVAKSEKWKKEKKKEKEKILSPPTGVVGDDFVNGSEPRRRLRRRRR